MNKKIHLYISELLLLYLLLIIPLLYTHTFTLFNGIALLLSLFSCSFIGAAILSFTGINALLLPLSQASLSLLAGGLLGSLLIFTTIHPLLLAAISPLMAVTAAILLRGRPLVVSALPARTSLWAFFITIACMALISSGEELMNQFTAFQQGYPFSTDNYFFTAVVASLRKGTIFNAAYEAGTPVNYQSLGFLLPAYLADLLKITSHQALWGLAAPLYKFAALLLCYDVCSFYLKGKAVKHRYLLMALCIVLPLLLTPLHPLYILKGVISKFIFNGIGYIIPAGVITYPFSFVLFLFSLLLFHSADWRSPKITGDKVLFTITAGLIIAAKAFLYINTTAFFGAILLRRIFYDKEKIKNYAGYIACYLAISLISFKLLMGQSQSGRSYLQYGYMAREFAGWYGRHTNGIANNLIIIGLIVFSYLFWTGIRLVGLYGLYRSGSRRQRELLTGTIISLAAITVYASFVRYQVMYSTGEVIADMDFNALGFLRANFYIITIVATIGTVWLLFAIRPSRLVIAAVGICCTLAFISTAKAGLFQYAYFARLRSPAVSDANPIPWYVDMHRELSSRKYDDGLIAADPDSPYSAMLAGSDYGAYWTSRSARLYNCGNKNEYRWLLFKDLLQHPQEQYLATMKNEGVKYIIATPADSVKMAGICSMFPARMARAGDSRWIYRLK